MAAEPDDLVLFYLKRIDEKLDRFLDGLAEPKRLPRHETEERDRLSELLDRFERLSPEEQARDIARANEILRTRGLAALNEPPRPLHPQEALK